MQTVRHTHTGGHVALNVLSLVSIVDTSKRVVVRLQKKKKKKERRNCKKDTWGDRTRIGRDEESLKKKGKKRDRKGKKASGREEERE